MTGEPRLVRLMGFGLRAPKQQVPGSDVAGVVEAVGANVTRFAPGDEVFGVGPGGFAEYVLLREDRCQPKPSHLPFEQAAAAGDSAVTALQALRDAGRLQAGQRVLVIGAGGGVGTFAVQIAVAMGASVTGVCSTGKVDLVRSLGADDVIDYTTDDPVDGSRTWDLILDCAGNRRLSHLRRALTPTGTLVIVGGEEGGRWFGGLGRNLRAAVLSLFGRQRLVSLFATVRSDDLAHVAGLLADGSVTFPWSIAPGRWSRSPMRSGMSSRPRHRQDRAPGVAGRPHQPRATNPAHCLDAWLIATVQGRRRTTVWRSAVRMGSKPRASYMERGPRKAPRRPRVAR
jgi:NADPH:quinone reductase-like Zn-dependent oxidoreductase